MNKQGWRVGAGHAVDEARPVRFTFDGVAYSGLAGDTLASALMANGVRLMGRSFKYHRPRGLVGIGAEEPNALVAVRRPGFCEPNTRATMAELYDDLDAISQNRWPSLRFDMGAVNDALAPFIPAGFYYKTFMGPTRKAWMAYEWMIRRAAGLGAASREPDPSRYEKMHAHADCVVVGGGEAGLSAAIEAATAGERVIIIDEAPALGGWRLREREVNGAQALVATLRGFDSVTVLTRTTAFGLYDGLQIAAVERAQDHLPAFDAHTPRQRLWLIRGKRIVLACGAQEQPTQFKDNDRPGVMLAGAVRGYLNQYGVAAGRRAVIVTNNDSAYQTALDLRAAGLDVAAVVDARETLSEGAAKMARDADVEVFAGAHVTRAIYKGGLRAAEIEQAGRIRSLPCDLIAMSGGWTPAIHLSTHLGGKPVYDEAGGFFLPPKPRPGIEYRGAMAGEGLDRAERPLRLAHDRAFVDFQGDVTVKDVKLAHREGYRSVEHLKRYTTLGMGTDQGKTSNLAGLTIMAGLTGKSVAETGVTTFRAPYTPVSIGALGGMDAGERLRPVRRTPMQDWHEMNGGAMGESGLWRRPKAYVRDGETVLSAQIREARAVRGGVGCVDVSTLGKIEAQGPDAAEFLDRIYASPVKTLKVGRARYGLMLREDGVVLDDGTLARLGPNHYYLTTTTAQAANVLAHMEYHAQVTWPEMRVSLVSVSDQYGAIAVAGPQSKALLSRLAGEEAFDDAAFPYASIKIIPFGGVSVRVLRMSYSGERAYELHVPADAALSLWEALIDAGATPYGTEAMAILRIEKGHVAGAELDGRTTAADLGLAKLASKPTDFIGKRMQARPGLVDAARPSLVGLMPADGASRIRSGAQITAGQDARNPGPMLGHVTSACFSPAMERPIALALLSGGLQRQGEMLFAHYPLRDETVAVTVVSPVFYDAEGARLHA
ncbi:MAG: 2Fe-2S iron-sulfur cluster-binding protein [Hyphomicrobiales bacterium]|nr:2Fe-2S iron-sulfur cluster-binding protein [Hyphomicrobiales bacterium]